MNEPRLPRWLKGRRYARSAGLILTAVVALGIAAPAAGASTTPTASPVATASSTTGASPSPAASSTPSAAPASSSPAVTPAPSVPIAAPHSVGPSPDNWPSGSGANPQFVQNQSSGLYWALTGSADYLITSSTVEYFTSKHFHNNSYGDAYEIIEVGGPHPGYCLGWNQSANEYDVRTTAPCNSNFTTGQWDLWVSSSTNQWSEAATLYNWLRGDCAWQGPIAKVTVQGCSGTNTLDKWQYINEYNT